MIVLVLSFHGIEHRMVEMGIVNKCWKKEPVTEWLSNEFGFLFLVCSLGHLVHKTSLFYAYKSWPWNHVQMPTLYSWKDLWLIKHVNLHYCNQTNKRSLWSYCWNCYYLPQMYIEVIKRKLPVFGWDLLFDNLLWRYMYTHCW